MCSWYMFSSVSLSHFYIIDHLFLHKFSSQKNNTYLISNSFLISILRQKVNRNILFLRDNNFWDRNDFFSFFGEFYAMYFGHIHSPTLPRSSFLPYSLNFVSFFKSFNTNYCFQNILGCVVFHWRAISLHGARLLNCLFLSQQLLIASSSMARGEILCWTPISILGFVWLRFTQALGMMLQLYELIWTHTLLCSEGKVFLYSSSGSDSYSLPLQWSLSLGNWAAIYISFRAEHFIVSSSMHKLLLLIETS